MTEEQRLRDKLRRALDDIIEERDYQLRRWSEDADREKQLGEWLVILTVYLGKAAQCTYPYNYTDDEHAQGQFRKRVTQLAAICAAILEATDTEEDK